MVIEKIEEQPPIFSEEAEAELSDKLKKLLLEVIDKGRINLEHGSDILSEII
jgi:polyhydroxyalkanoate synthesis regulator phasin